MIEKMIKEGRKYLPLRISEVNWNGTVFHMYGNSWNFTALCGWRISTFEKVVFACFDDDSKRSIQILKGFEIVGLEIQESILKIDPVFIFSNGQKLEIFSTDTFEPWTFSFNDAILFVPTPGDPSFFGY